MLANLNDVLKPAQAGKYAVGLFKTTDTDMLEAAISAAEERGDTLSALYGQYQLDVSNVLNSYNDRKTRGGYKSDAQDFYDRTMAMTTAARDSIFKLTDNICCLGILFLVLLDGQTVLDAETGGDQTKQADEDEKNAHYGCKRCSFHTFPLINSSVVCPWEGKWHFNYLYAVCLHFVNKLSNC